EFPLRRYRKLSQRNVIPALGIREKRFAAGADPFHRPPQATRGPDQQRFLGVMLSFVAEAAPHVLGDDAQFSLVDAELLAYVVPDVVRRLRSHVERVRSGERTARLNRCATQPVVDQLDFYFSILLRENFLNCRSIAA